MRALFWLLTLAALAIGVALLGRLTDGYVLWVVPPWRAEMSFNLYVLLQLLALFVLYLLLRVLAITLDLPSLVAGFRLRRARQREQQAASESLRLFWEGRYSHVIKVANRVGRRDIATLTQAGDRVSDAEGIAALVGLKAAHALRDPARIEEWRARAGRLDEAGWRTARLLAEARIALDGRDFNAARAVLDQLGNQERRRISVQRLALRLAHGMGDWPEMLRLTRLLEKHKALTPEQAGPLRQHAYHGILDTLQDDPAQLERHWHDMPTPDRLDLRLAQRAARALAQAGASAENARLIEDYLDERWESALLDSYATCPGGDVLARIAQCEKWLHASPRDAQLLLALGRLCARQQLWGKAQSYLEASLAVSPGCAAHLELARLFDQLDRPEEANRHYRIGANCMEQTAQIQSRGVRKSL